MSSNCSGLEVARQRPEFLYIVRRFNADIARLSAHEANMGPDDAYPRLLGLGVSCALSVPTPRHPRRQLTHVRPLTASQRCQNKQINKHGLFSARNESLSKNSKLQSVACISCLFD